MSHNSFPKDSWSMFAESWTCWVCGMNTANCLHHIMGRGAGHSTAEASVYNAAYLCNQSCHLQIHGRLRTDSHSRQLLHKTKEYLRSIGYSNTDNDAQFLKKYEHMYRTKGSNSVEEK